jgi:hypothetical protein
VDRSSLSSTQCLIHSSIVSATVILLLGVVEAAFAAFDEILEAHGATQFEALIVSFCFFRALEGALTPEQRANFRGHTQAIDQEVARRWPDSGLQ